VREPVPVPVGELVRVPVQGPVRESEPASAPARGPLGGRELSWASVPLRHYRHRTTQASGC